MREGVTVAVPVAVAVDVDDGVMVGVRLAVTEGTWVHIRIGVVVAVSVGAPSGLLVSVAPPVSGMRNSLSSAIGNRVPLMTMGTMYALIPIIKSVRYSK